MLKTLSELVLFEDSGNRCSLSRPILSLILASEGFLYPCCFTRCFNWFSNHICNILDIIIVKLTSYLQFKCVTIPSEAIRGSVRFNTNPKNNVWDCWCVEDGCFYLWVYMNWGHTVSLGQRTRFFMLDRGDSENIIQSLEARSIVIQMLMFTVDLKCFIIC